MNDMTTLTAEDVAANLAAIENTEATDATVQMADRLLSSCPYASTALTALSIALSEMGDVKAANMLLAAAQDMAKHESETI